MAHKFKREVKDVHQFSGRDLLKLIGVDAPPAAAQVILALDSSKQYVNVIVSHDEVVTVD
jgi:hypothetical protein